MAALILTSCRFAHASQSPMSGVKSACSPTKRSPASTSVHTRSIEQVSRAPGSGSRSSKPSRRRSAASVSASSGSDSEEETESPAVARSARKPGGRVMRIESSDSDDDEALVNLAAPQNKCRLVEEVLLLLRRRRRRRMRRWGARRRRTRTCQEASWPGVAS